MQAPQNVAEGLMQHRIQSLMQGAGARVGPGRGVDAYCLVLKEFADAEDVVGITDREAALHVIGPHDDGHALGGLCRI